MNAVDTNILIYVHDPRNPKKQDVAAELVAGMSDGALVWQVACEYLNASRKLEPFGFSYARAAEEVRVLQKVWSTILPDWNILDRLPVLRANYCLSIWDGLLVAACLEAGVSQLFTEDFDAYAAIEALEIVNPFRGIE
jgi:predicted nucleic acid-binding protein